MVRTKVSRNTASKRNRTSHQEERYINIVREFEILFETYNTSLDAKQDADLEKLNYLASTMKSRIPKEMLQMTMGDLRKTGCNLFVDVLNMGSAIEDMANGSNCSQLSIGSAGGPTSLQKSYRTDEGYLTEENAKQSLDVMASAKPSKRPIGPLDSAMKKSRRRSKSVSGHTITPCKPAQSSMLFGVKSTKADVRMPGKSLFLGQSERFSRPKFRTPMAEVNKKGRTQAVSTDRGMSQITLKVEPNTPLAFIRYPRADENVYSLTGSPVVNEAMTRHMANVNIPVSNGVLSLQPTDLGDVDTKFLPKIDYATLEHLKKLQANLNKIMQYAEECNFHIKK
uniref:Borealin C-terminal domain-containing protein n=1 Tax=Anopheles funestus TaxID=62324 RepID=A0A182RCX7_ANOFN